MTLLFQNHHGVGNVFFAQTGEAESLCFEVNRKQEGKVVEKCRDARCKQDFCVTYSHEFRHDKANGTHDGRCKLPAGGSNCFDCGCKLLLIAGFLHHGDGDCSSCSHIGYGRSVDHAQKSTGQHRNFCRSSGSSPYQRQRDVVDELAESTVFQVSSEEHEKENVGGTHPYSYAKDPLAAPNHVVEYPFDAESDMAEISGDPLAQKVVEQEYQSKDGKVFTCPPPGFKDENHDDACNPNIETDQISASFGNRDVIFQEIGKADAEYCQQYHIPDRWKGAFSVFGRVGWKQEKREEHEKQEVPGPQRHSIDDANGVCIHLKYRPKKE